jgi:hypothetical protein
MENACKNIEEQIVELMTGTLSAEKTAQLKEHVTQCTVCSEYLQNLQTDDKLLNDFAQSMQPTVAQLEQNGIDALNRSTSDKVTNFASMRSTIVRSRITRFATAALIIIAALIGIKMLSSSDEQPSRKAVREDGVHNKEFLVEQAGGNLDVELDGIEQMFKVGNVDGLVAMLSEGEFESKVAAANYLAKMGAVQAIGPLEVLNAQYYDDDPDNAFGWAIETINNRAGGEPGEISPETKIAKADTPAQLKTVVGTAGVNNLNRGTRERAIHDSAMRYELLGALTESFQAEAKEVADGYPIKGGGNSVVEVVPASLHQNLMLYYSFHTNTNAGIAVDISGKDLHGQVHRAKYINDEILGGVMSFDGDDDYLNVPDVHWKQFTFSAWVKTQSSGINNRRIFLLTDGEQCYGLQGNVRGCVGVYVANDMEVNEYNWRLVKDTWTHITVTHDGQTFKIYRNGVLTEAGDIATSGVTGTLYIGGTSRHRGGFWHGLIDEVAIFDRALIEEEVVQLYLMTGEVVEVPEVVEESGIVGIENELVEVDTTSSTKHTIATGFTGVSVYPADVDGDGDLDVVGAAGYRDSRISTRPRRSATGLSLSASSGAVRTRPEIVDSGEDDEEQVGAGIKWWENTDGKGTVWSEHIVDANVSAVRFTYPADVDRDGDVDIIGSASTNNIFWWENSGGDGRSWTKHLVDGSTSGFQLIHGADINGDGYMDVVGATFLDGGITWWKNVSGNGTNWQKHTVDGTTDADYCRTHCLHVADMDGDGKLDIVASAGRESGINWWENPKDGDAAWTRHYVVGSDGEVESVYPADLDGDGDTDIIGSIRRHDGLTWWENTNGAAMEWTKHVIDSSYHAEQSVDVADMDGDGDLDILGAAQRIKAMIWWENKNNNATEWSKHVMSKNFRDAYSAYAADMDNDGGMDVLGLGQDTQEIAWFENRPAQP